VGSSEGHKWSCEARTLAVGARKDRSNRPLSLFNENDRVRLKEKIETWLKLPYMADCKQIILDCLDAHRFRSAIQ
jgi:hypothetical protein